MTKKVCREGDHICSLDGYYPTLYYIMSDQGRVIATYGCLLRAKEMAKRLGLWLIQESTRDECIRPLRIDNTDE